MSIPTNDERLDPTETPRIPLSNVVVLDDDNVSDFQLVVAVGFSLGVHVMLT
jgi:hypothetical protein